MVCAGNVTDGGSDACQVLFIHSNHFFISLNVLMVANIEIITYFMNFYNGNERSQGHTMKPMRIISNKRDAKL